MLNNTEKVHYACESALKEKKMIGIIGYPGSGKTVAAKMFANEYQNVYYVSLSQSKTPKNFYSDLLSEIKEIDLKTNIPTYLILKEIERNLISIEGKKLIIIDEIGKFSGKKVGIFHELKDKMEKLAGIVLLGPDYFLDNLEDWKTKKIQGVEEFARRVTKWIHLDRPTSNEVLYLLRKNEIDLNDKGFKAIKDFMRLPMEDRNWSLLRDLVDECLAQKEDS